MILCCATAAMLFTTTTTYLASYSSLLYGCEMSICSCTGIIFFKKKNLINSIWAVKFCFKIMKFRLITCYSYILMILLEQNGRLLNKSTILF